MSRAAIRDAVTARIADSDIIGFASAFPAPPRVIPGAAFEAGQQAGQGWGVVSITHITATRDLRVAIGGEHSGWKRVDYDLALEVILHWARTDDDGSGATVALDQFLDDLKDWIRSDRRAATSNDVVWQWGEDVSDAVGEPVMTDQLIAITAVVRTTVTQFIQA